MRFPPVPARPRPSGATGPFVVGILEGEGIGPEVLRPALGVLAAVEAAAGLRFDLRDGGRRGMGSDGRFCRPIAPELYRFFRDVFEAGGPVVCRPGAGRFVYDLRKELDLFCKLVPVRTFPELREAGRLRGPHVDDVDILIICENASGLYFGSFHEERSPAEGRRIEYSFSYSEREVRRILEVALAFAQAREGKMAVVTKEDGVPGIGALWRDCAKEVAAGTRVQLSILNVDYAAYCLVQHPADLDVVVTSNLFGDVLADLSAVLVGSRGLSFSGNFAPSGAAVYQTNHGAALDLVGKDQANPVAQILALAMMLRTSLGLDGAADLIERAIADVWRAGWRTVDLAEPGSRIVGTSEMGRRIAEAVGRIAPSRRERWDRLSS